MTEKSYTYKCDLYRCYVRINFLNKVEVEGDGGIVDSGYKGVDNTFDILFSKPNPILGDILHEATHVKNGICKFIEHKLEVDNDEVECYLMGWIGDKIEDAIKKFNK